METQKTFYLFDEGDATLACTLREELERLALHRDGSFVSCTQVHPLDKHIECVCPNVEWVRTALQNVASNIARARKDVAAQLPVRSVDTPDTLPRSVH